MKTKENKQPVQVRSRQDLQTNNENINSGEQTIYDPTTKKRYIRRNFLGKGGFAKCYEVLDPDTNTVYACKIVSKSQLVKQHQKDKMASEIAIHKSLDHPNVVKFYRFFEDSSNVYILLEICRKKTLLEVHKRRKTLTDPEVRYYMHQILVSCKYMHDNNIIHRDLKLGNLFLDDELQVKVGDFGLAAKIEREGERKKTLCGTPNYIAPEILNKGGHSFEVDIWSIGCILYTFYVGIPPFESSTVKDTYHRIKKNAYTIPSKVPKLAQILIVKLLQSDPARRPDVNTILRDPYFASGYLPVSLPLSSLTVPPRFPSALQTSHIRPSERVPINVKEPVKDGMNAKQFLDAQTPIIKPVERSHALRVCDSEMTSFDDGDQQEPEIESKDCYLGDIHDLVAKCLEKHPHKLPRVIEDETEDPASSPLYWITKWVDYSERYGIGYQLSDNSFGVLFNDQTRLISTEDKGMVTYIDSEGVEIFMSITNYDPSLKKKMTLLIYFYDYMRKNLLTAGTDIVPGKNYEMVRLPTLKMWRRDNTHIVFLLSCGIIQVNFFDDHCKLIICPKLAAVTFIDQHRRSHTYRFSLIEKYGCSVYLASRLKTVLLSVKALIDTTKANAPHQQES